MSMSDLKQLDKLSEILADCKEVDDKQVAIALDEVLVFIVNPEAAMTNAQTLMVKLQALSTKCALLARHYTTFETGRTGTIENKKKHFYYTVAEELEKMVAVMKIMSRN